MSVEHGKYMNTLEIKTSSQKHMTSTKSYSVKEFQLLHMVGDMMLLYVSEIWHSSSDTLKKKQISGKNSLNIIKAIIGYKKIGKKTTIAYSVQVIKQLEWEILHL